MKYWGALLLIPLGLLFTPVANADIYNDLMFVKDVNNAGITYDSRENLIGMGHELCNALESGNIDYPEIVQIVDRDPHANLAQSNLMASSAVEHICPDQWYQVVTSQIAFPREARILI